MHDFVALFLEVIAPAIILLVMGLGTLRVLVDALRAVASIVSMMIVRSSIIMVASITSMIVAIFTTEMLTVAQFTATCGNNMSCFLFLWLLVLGDLLENASRLVHCLTLLKEGNHLEWVSRHHLV